MNITRLPPQDEELVKAKAIEVPGIEDSSPSVLGSTRKAFHVQNIQFVRMLGPHHSRAAYIVGLYLPASAVVAGTIQIPQGEVG